MPEYKLQVTEIRSTSYVFSVDVPEGATWEDIEKLRAEYSGEAAVPLATRAGSARRVDIRWDGEKPSPAPTLWEDPPSQYQTTLTAGFLRGVWAGHPGLLIRLDQPRRPTYRSDETGYVFPWEALHPSQVPPQVRATERGMVFKKLAIAKGLPEEQGFGATVIDAWGDHRLARVYQDSEGAVYAIVYTDLSVFSRKPEYAR